MNYNSQTDDELLRGVLYRADSVPGDDTDDADELMALFLEGKLQGEDRTAFFRHLDTHSAARRAAGFAAKHVGHQPAAASARSHAAEALQPSNPVWMARAIDRVGQFLAALPRWGQSLVDQAMEPSHAGAGTMIVGRHQAKLAYAMAGMLLVATTGVLWFAWRSPSEMQLLAVRGGPSLRDYDYSPDRTNATVRMGADEAESHSAMQALLDTAPVDEREQLRKAYGFLDTKQSHQAQNAFAEIVAQHPQSYYARLGQGLAWFMGQQPEDFEKAESAFRQALELRGDSAAAREGLAMALTRQKGKTRQALAEWKKVEANRFSKAHREEIQREINRLEKLP